MSCHFCSFPACRVFRTWRRRRRNLWVTSYSVRPHHGLVFTYTYVDSHTSEKTTEPKGRRSAQAGHKVEVLLYVHRNRRLIRDGSPERPPPLSHSFWALPDTKRQSHHVKRWSAVCGKIHCDYRGDYTRLKKKLYVVCSVFVLLLLLLVVVVVVVWWCLCVSVCASARVITVTGVKTIQKQFRRSSLKTCQSPKRS